MAEEGIRAGASASTLLKSSPRDLGARGEVLYCAWLCGSVLGATTMGLHHRLCHTLGGGFDLPHAGVHTVQPPYPNSRALERAALRALLQRAFDGAASAA